MAADFDAIDFGADVIGMVDHPVRQPQQPLLDDLQMVRHARIFHSSIEMARIIRTSSGRCLRGLAPRLCCHRGRQQLIGLDLTGGFAVKRRM